MTSKPASMRIAGILYDSLSGWVDAPTTAMVVAHSRTPRRSWSPRTAPATPGGLFEPWVVVTRFQTSREGELFLRSESIPLHSEDELGERLHRLYIGASIRGGKAHGCPGDPGILELLDVLPASRMGECPANVEWLGPAYLSRVGAGIGNPFLEVIEPAQLGRLRGSGDSRAGERRPALAALDGAPDRDARVAPHPDGRMRAGRRQRAHAHVFFNDTATT